MKQRKWTEKEISEMIVLVAESKTNRQIGDKLGRTVGAVSHKRSDIGLTDERLAEMAAEIEEEKQPDIPEQIEQIKQALGKVRESLESALGAFAEIKEQQRQSEQETKAAIDAIRKEADALVAYLSRSALHRAAHRYRCPYVDGRGGHE